MNLVNKLREGLVGIIDFFRKVISLKIEKIWYRDIVVKFKRLK